MEIGSKYYKWYKKNEDKLVKLSDDEIDREWDYYCQSICDNGHTK